MVNLYSRSVLIAAAALLAQAWASPQFLQPGIDRRHHNHDGNTSNFGDLGLGQSAVTTSIEATTVTEISTEVMTQTQIQIQTVTVTAVAPCTVTTGGVSPGNTTDGLSTITITFVSYTTAASSFLTSSVALGLATISEGSTSTKTDAVAPTSVTVSTSITESSFLSSGAPFLGLSTVTPEVAPTSKTSTLTRNSVITFGLTRRAAEPSPTWFQA